MKTIKISMMLCLAIIFFQLEMTAQIFQPTQNQPTIQNQYQTQPQYAQNFNISSSGNLLQNGTFDIPNQNGPVSSFKRTQPNIGGGQSGAAVWTTWANQMGSTIETEWMNSTFTGGHMLRVSTNGHSNGIVNTFGRTNEGHEEVTACVWLFIERGTVTVGVGNGGNIRESMVLVQTGKWERITVSNSVSPANQIVIYSYSQGGADFYVESAAVYPGPPQEMECCQPE